MESSTLIVVLRSLEAEPATTVDASAVPDVLATAVLSSSTFDETGGRLAAANVVTVVRFVEGFFDGSTAVVGTAGGDVGVAGSVVAAVGAEDGTAGPVKCTAL